MKTKSFYEIVILTLFILVLLFSLQAFAAEKELARIVEGVVMSINLQKNTMVVNEKAFIWDKKTIFLDESGTPITPDQLKVDRKVHIEGERMGQKRLFLIKEIRLLPK